MLVDFGVARALGSEEDGQGTIAVGTPRYMAPEVFAGGTVTAASDIFSLAATLWTLLIGTPPRYGDVLKLDKLAPEPAAGAARRRWPAAWRCCPSSGSPRRAAFAEAVGVPLTGDRGHSLAQSLGRPPHAPRSWRRSCAPPPACSRPRPARSRSPTPRTASSSTRPPGAPAPPRSSGCGSRPASASPARSWPPATACSCPSAARTRASPARSPPAPATCRTRWSSRR